MKNAGRAKDRVSFEQRGVDAHGDRLGAWSVVLTRPAQLQPLRGGEAVMGQRLAGIQPMIISVRSERATRAIDPVNWRAFNARTGERYSLKSPGQADPKSAGWLDFLVEATQGER